MFNAQIVSARNAAAVGGRVVWFTASVLAAVFFVHAAMRFLVFTEASYKVFWVNRYALLAHFVGGSIALLAGIFQFWAGLRERYPAAHRITGTLYLAGGALGAAAAFYMSFNSVVGWTFGVAGFTMAGAWTICTAMAFAAIRRRQVQAHREWMIRGYVVLFGFVVFRALFVSPLFAGLGTLQERLTAIMWLCWVAPLLVAEVVLQWRRTFGPLERTPPR